MKLVLGILSIILSVIVFFQSIIAMLGDALEDVGGVGGFTGILVSIAMLVAGIITLAGRRNKGVHITAIVFWVGAGLLGLLLAGNYGDLYIWSTICIIFGILSYLFIVRKIKKEQPRTDLT